LAKYRILFARFPGNFQENPDCTDWLVRSMIHAKLDPTVEKVMSWYKSDTPITMTRNAACEVAKSCEADFVVMVDNDMFPDRYWTKDPKAKQFFPLAFAFLKAHKGPAMIAVPYCGPPPLENIYIFRWATSQSDHPDIDLKIDQYTREEAAVQEGIEEVAALPTGVCMFSTSALSVLTPPYFYYEWKKGLSGEDFQMEKASTEDVTFSRDLAFAGVPIYCAWDCWAGHWKRKCVGKPNRINVRDVSAKYFDVVRRHDRQDFEQTGTCRCCGRIEERELVPVYSDSTDKKQLILDAKFEAAKVIEPIIASKYHGNSAVECV